MRGHQLHQVVGFRRTGQTAQANDPVLVLPALLANERLEKTPFLDAVDRCAHLFELIAEEIKRATVFERGAAVQVQAGVRMRHGQHGFLNRGIGGLALHQDVPRHERTVIVVG